MQSDLQSNCMADRGPFMTKTILIVEDNTKNRVLLRDILRFHGYETIEASDGNEGVIKAKEQKPDLVLMDIQLPGKDGFEALRELRSDPETAGLIIIALTSFAMKGDRERILASGFDDYLAKPVDTRKLPHLLKAFLGARSHV
jgi:two-component system cell cycle response regulator DivK